MSVIFTAEEHRHANDERNKAINTNIRSVHKVTKTLVVRTGQTHGERERKLCGNDTQDLSDKVHLIISLAVVTVKEISVFIGEAVILQVRVHSCRVLEVLLLH